MWSAGHCREKARVDTSSAGTPDDEDLILQWKGGLASGWHAGGWYCEEQLNLVEIDNWGGRSWPEDQWHDHAGRAAQGRWGWDDISWFARRSDQQRHDFLTYVHRMCRVASPMNFFQPPLCRTLGNTPMTEYGPTAGYYRANQQDATCPSGRNDEDAILSLWHDADPADWSCSIDDTPSEVSIPFPVVLLGNIQRELGGTINDTLCPFSQLKDIGDSRAGNTFILPQPGRWQFVVASGGTRMEPLGQGMSPGGAAWQIVTTEKNQPVQMIFDYGRRTLSAVDPRNSQSLLDF